MKATCHSLMLLFRLLAVFCLPGNVMSENCWTNIPLPELVKEALEGNADAECEVGRRYAAIVDGGEKILTMQAYYWYWQASEHGSVEAARQLTNTCWTSIDLFRKNKVALLTAIGDDCYSKQQFEKSLVWYQWAVAEGNSSYWLYKKIGDVYRCEKGGYADCVEALKWYSAAVAAMDELEPFHANNILKETLCRIIGDMYAEGAGAEKSQAEARKWYRKADRVQTPRDRFLDNYDPPKWEFDPDDMEFKFK